MQKAIFQPIKSNETLKDRTVEFLTDAILKGKIKAGERLNESYLARELHISRAPVREALQQLQEQSLIINHPRRGMFVVDLDQVDIRKINSIRVVLEGEALRLAQRNLTIEGQLRLERVLQSMENAEPAPTKVSMRIDFEFHRMIWKLSGNEYLERILTSLTAPLFVHSVRNLMRSDQLRMILDSHRPLFDFIRGKSAKTAEQLILEHLSVRYPILERTRNERITDNRPNYIR